MLTILPTTMRINNFQYEVMSAKRYPLPPYRLNIAHTPPPVYQIIKGVMYEALHCKHTKMYFQIYCFFGSFISWCKFLYLNCWSLETFLFVFLSLSFFLRGTTFDCSLLFSIEELSTSKSRYEPPSKSKPRLTFLLKNTIHQRFL